MNDDDELLCPTCVAIVDSLCDDCECCLDCCDCEYCDECGFRLDMCECDDECLDCGEKICKCSLNANASVTNETYTGTMDSQSCERQAVCGLARRCDESN